MTTFGASHPPIKNTDGLPLEEWLEVLLSPSNGRDYLTVDYCFPSKEIQDEYLATVRNRPDEQVKDLLRLFLVEGGVTGLDFIKRASWEQMGRLNELMDRFEFVKRLTRKPLKAWEGNTWVLDLLPRYPQMAIDAINAYIIAHIAFIADKHLWGLNDAITIIRAKYFEAVHHRSVLLSLRSRDFEYLIAALYEQIGYKVQVTPTTRDGGYDVIARKDEVGQTEYILIECKRYESKVAVKDVRALSGVVGAVSATKGIIVTTASFTEPAKKWMEHNKRIDLIPYSELDRLLNRYLGSDWPTYVDFHISQMKRKQEQASALLRDS